MKCSTSFELALDFRPMRGERQQAFYHALRQAIAAGRLQPGTRLPSTRDLAKAYGLARATMVSVFEQLAVEGYIIARHGAGTFVCERLPETFLNNPTPPDVPASRDALTARPALSRRGALLAQSPFPLDNARPIRPLAPHLPSLESFPAEDWARTLAQSSKRLGLVDRAGGHPMGYPPLRQALASYLTTARGVRCTAQQILVVSGAQQAFDLTVRLLLDPGERVLVEDPGYAGAMQVFTAAGTKPHPVAVDEEGMDVRPQSPPFMRARLAYLTPAHQAPTGAALSLARRHALLAWARERRAWIFEDDYDSEYRYTGQPLPALQGLDCDGAVLHAGSFGKTMFPALRLGYLVLPEPLTDAFAAARSLTDRYPPIESQAALAEFIASGRYAAHLRRMRLIYEERRTALAEAVNHHLHGIITLSEHSAGLETVGWLPRHMDDREIARAASRKDCAVEPVSERYLSARHRRPGLLLGFAATPPAAIKTAVERLASVVAGMPKR